MTTTPPPQIIVGTMAFGGTADEEESAAIVRLALDAGLEWFDTANAYEDGRGEHILGRLTVGTPARIATKVGLQPGRLQPDVIARSLRESLYRLDRPLVDRLTLHAPDRETPFGDSLLAVARAIDEGIVGEVGVSNVSHADLREYLNAADSTGSPRPTSAQLAFSLLARAIDDPLFSEAAALGVALHAFSPLAGGLLGGRPGASPGPGRFSSSNLGPLYVSRYWKPRLLAAADSLADVADDADMTLSELAIRWVVGHAGVDAVLIGPSRASHLSQAVAAVARGPLDDALRTRCDAIADGVRDDFPSYAR